MAKSASKGSKAKKKVSPSRGQKKAAKGKKARKKKVKKPPISWDGL